ncbi:MAG: hypothetical protein OEM41_01250 [Ignavibacteria bacterium]|nr:hypothetical protein [Ignavibacteria bacterium]
MKEYLEPTELFSLIETVFEPGDNERWLSILVDLPDETMPDTERWSARRRIARTWFANLAAGNVCFTGVRLVTYPHVGSNNADLPEDVSVIDQPGAVSSDQGTPMPLSTVLRNSSVLLALTELSATAPLKNLARQYQFRGATLPGFQKEMIPALGINYHDVHKRVLQFKERMDIASAATIQLAVNEEVYTCMIDLRFRTAHASSGLMRKPGEVGNLPSGEAYIVPYEGERKDEESRTAGHLPVQFGHEIVVYEIDQNRARKVTSTGAASDNERKRLEEEPAYGNIAELGIGVLGHWGMKPVGSILLDEKLGPHIAFGRSEHFGGITGPSAFRDPRKVVHIDRVYMPATQPMISVRELSFLDGTRKEVIMRNDEFIV